jgi:putative Holliday junction resolvase
MSEERAITRGDLAKISGSPFDGGSLESVDPRAAADAFELLAHAAGRIRAIVHMGHNAGDQGKHRGGPGADQGNGGSLTRRLAEFVGQEQADAKPDRRLGEGDDSGHGKVFPKLFERDGRHGIAHRRFVVWDFQLEMETKRFLGLDPGDARVGVAISDELGLLAHPLETIEVRKTDPVARVAELASEKSIVAIVVGVPRNMDGSFGPAAEKSRAFIEALKSRVSCRVVPWDERLTTVSAQRALHDAGRKAKEHRKVIDQAAAQILLQSWLDAAAGAAAE